MDSYQEHDAVRKNISSGSPFEELAGYSRAVAFDSWVVVSGTIGSDPSGTLPDSVAQQAQNSFRTIETALDAAGASLADVVRCAVYVTSAEYVKDVVPVLAAKFGNIRPANTTIVCQLPPPGAKVEIEVWAYRASPKKE